MVAEKVAKPILFFSQVYISSIMCIFTKAISLEKLFFFKIPTKSNEQKI